MKNEEGKMIIEAVISVVNRLSQRHYEFHDGKTIEKWYVDVDRLIEEIQPLKES